MTTDRTRRANGEGTVHYDPKLKRWVAMASAGRDDATGKRRRIKRTGVTKTEATRKLAAAVKAAEHVNTAGPRTVSELLERWLAAGAPSSKRKGDKWLDATRSLVDGHLTPALGHHRVDALRPEHVEIMLAARTHLSRSTVKHLRGTLAQAYDWAISRRSAQWNPARVTTLPEVDSPAATRRALTSEETGSLLAAAADHRLGAWIVLALALGLRPGECSALRWEDVDLKKGVVVVYATKTKTTRTLRIPVEVVATLKAHRRHQVQERLYAGDRWPAEHDGLLFRTERGTPLDRANTRRLVQRLGQAAGIDGNLTSYDLRHTATTRFSAAGVAPELLADLLGHQDTRMVFAHYRHPVTPVIEVAADNFDGAYPS